MSDISFLTKKLRMMGVKRALLLNAPDGYMDLLGELPGGLVVDFEIKGKYDFAHLFIKDRAALAAHIDAVLGAIDYDAIFWISYPKGSSGIKTDINRDSLWELMEEGKGIRPVTQVSIDETWSAVRFRPSEAVGT